jgi:hypothetical protein
MGRVSTGAALVVFAVLVVGCGPRVAHAQTLSLAYVKGDHYQYKVHVVSDNTINMGGPGTIKFDLTATETVAVRSVDSAGVADVNVSLSKVTVKTSFGDGKNMTSTTTTTTTVPDVTLKIGPDGRLQGADVAGMSLGFMGGMSGGPSLISAVLPETAVRPGDTWSKDYDQANPGGTGSVHVTTKSKYLRDETIKSVNAAVIETTSTASINLTMDLGALMPKGPSMNPSPINGGPPTGAIPSGKLTVKGTVDSDTTSWIDASAHRMLKTQMHGKYDMTTSFDMPPDASTHIPFTAVGVKGTQQVSLDPA